MKTRLLRILLLTSVSIISMASVVYAEDNGTTGTNFTFRGIPWNTARADAEQLLEDDGAKKNWETSDIYRLSAVDYLHVTSGDEVVEGGGCKVTYHDLTVAGYTPSRTNACYLYQIDENGKIDKTKDTSQFYMGWYEFENDDFSDMEAIYNDLLTKLTSLYGDGNIDQGESSQYFWTDTWTDNDGNVIQLLINGMEDRENQEISLAYIAADADERLDAMENALDAETAANEAEQREANKDNTSGL